MLAAIIRWSLRFPTVVCALAVILVMYGVVVLAHSKYDVFPEFVPPQASVQTEAPVRTRDAEQSVKIASKIVQTSFDLDGLSLIAGHSP